MPCHDTLVPLLAPSPLVPPASYDTPSPPLIWYYFTPFGTCLPLVPVSVHPLCDPFTHLFTPLFGTCNPPLVSILPLCYPFIEPLWYPFI